MCAAKKQTPPRKKEKPQPEKRPQGRPSAYTEALADQILEQVASTTKSLNTICKENNTFPAAGTVRRWISENRKASEEREGFRDKYARAKEEQADMMADEILEIADSAAEEPTHEKIGAARLRVDARKWVASKLKPKKYGDKTDITTDGESLNKGFYDFLKETSHGS